MKQADSKVIHGTKPRPAGGKSAAALSGGPDDWREERVRASALLDERLWGIEDVAEYLDDPKQSIYSWRSTGYGPQGFRVGKHLRWRPSTVKAWVAHLERAQPYRHVETCSHPKVSKQEAHLV